MKTITIILSVFLLCSASCESSETDNTYRNPFDSTVDGEDTDDDTDTDDAGPTEPPEPPRRCPIPGDYDHDNDVDTDDYSVWKAD
jgi:hypothetical protein